MTTPKVLQPVTYQSIGQVTGFILVPRGSGQANVYNGDIANVLYVSPNPTPTPGNSIPVQPLTNATLDGSVALYASAAAGLPVANVTVSASSQISPSPAQIATQIATLGLATATNQVAGTAAINNPAYGPATLSRQVLQESNIPNNMAITGVPLLNLSNLVLTVTPNTTINVNTSTTFPGSPLLLNQPGMEIVFQVDAAGPTSVCRFTINWLDGAGNFLSNDNYWVYAGTTGNPHTLYAKGPTDGLQCTFQIGAYLTNIRIVKMLVYLNSKIYDQWQFETQSMPALANTFNLSLIEPAALIQGRRAAAVIAAGATDVTCLGMYVGQAWLFALTSSGTNDMTVKIQNAADQFGQDFFVSYKSDGAGQINQYIQMPRGQSLLSMINNNAAQQTMRYMLIETVD